MLSSLCRSHLTQPVFFLRFIYVSYLYIFVSQIHNSLKEIFSFPIFDLALNVRDGNEINKLN